MSSVAISPPLFSITSLVAGRYHDGQGYCYDLESPTFLTDSRSLYVFKAATGIKGCEEYNTFTAQIISGPAVGHPGIGHRSIVKDIQYTYVYGIIADGQKKCCSDDNKISGDWDSNEIVGLMQAGGNLTVALFTNSEGKDSNIPVKIVILEKVELE
jgi:hypothetical protein